MQDREKICDMCDGLVVTGSANDVYPKYYGGELIEGKQYKFIQSIERKFNRSKFLGIQKHYMM